MHIYEKESFANYRNVLSKEGAWKLNFISILPGTSVWKRKVQTRAPGLKEDS